MTEHTPIDAAHAAMTAAPDDDTPRLRFYERLAASELFVLLEGEAEGDKITPQLFDAEGTQYVLAFDREERLAGFAGPAAPYAALSGRVTAGLLAANNLGLGLNLEVAPSAILLPPDAMAWLDTTLGNAPKDVEAKVESLTAPKGLPDSLIEAIDEKLATATGLARYACLVGVTYAGGGSGHMLGFVGALPHAESALAQAASEALTFSGIEAGAMDVAFFRADDPMAERLARTGLRFDLPQPEDLSERTRPAPGSDPAKPPILK